MIIAIDFDGTITKEHKYPEVGEIEERTIEVLKKLHPDDIKLNCKGKFTNNYDDIPKVEK